MQMRFLIVLLLCVGATAHARAQNGSRPAGLQFRAAHDTVLRADAARDRGDTAKAMELYQEAMGNYARLSSAFPDWQPGVTRFGMEYCREQLSALLRRVTDVMPGSGTPQPAVTVPRRAGAGLSTPNANRPSILSEDAVVLLSEGRTPEARQALLSALREDPDDRRVRLLLAVARCQEGACRDAVYVLEQLVSERSDDVFARMALAAAYSGVGQIDNAIRELNHTLAIKPKLSEAHYNMAHLLLALEPPARDGAIHHYKRAVELGGAADPELAERLGVAAADADKEPGERRGLLPFRLFRRSADKPEDAQP